MPITVSRAEAVPQVICCTIAGRSYHVAMALFLILAVIFFPLVVLNAWFHKRLRDALATRHPATLHTIDRMTRSAPRGPRAVERRARYAMLQDPEIDRHLRNRDRVQIAIQYVFLAAFVLVFIVSLVSVTLR